MGLRAWFNKRVLPAYPVVSRDSSMTFNSGGLGSMLTTRAVWPSIFNLVFDRERAEQIEQAALAKAGVVLQQSGELSLGHALARQLSPQDLQLKEWLRFDGDLANGWVAAAQGDAANSICLLFTGCVVVPTWSLTTSIDAIQVLDVLAEHTSSQHVRRAIRFVVAGSRVAQYELSQLSMGYELRVDKDGAVATMRNTAYFSVPVVVFPNQYYRIDLWGDDGSPCVLLGYVMEHRGDNLGMTSFSVRRKRI